MKKIASILLALIVVFVMSACTEENQKSESKVETVEESVSNSAIKTVDNEKISSTKNKITEVTPNEQEDIIIERISDNADNSSTQLTGSQNSSNISKIEERNFWTIREDMVKNAKDWKEKNSDTVGWLYIYDTTVDSPVFQTDNNDYYLKHNDYKENDVNGAIVSSYTNILSGRDTQSKNIVFYGHSKDENPNGGVEISREFEHFTELKRYKDIEFCKENPYILFATADESMVFEVFAIFHTKTSFVYNVSNPTEKQMGNIISEAKKKSLFNFNVEVVPKDRIITLSTCDREIETKYPNDYRFVLMGRLVEKGKLLNYERDVEVNPTALTINNIYE